MSNRFFKISLGMLLFTFFVTETDCRVRDGYYQNLKNLSDSAQPPYSMDFRKILLDAHHVIEKVLSKGKRRVLGVDEWF